MFSNSKHDKVTHFGLWADSARDHSFRKEALRICADAAERCIDLDLRTCPQLQQALAYLEQNADRTSVIARFRRALDKPDPQTRSREVQAAYAAVARATAISPSAD